MAYTTNAKVRIAAGIVGNLNISTASIDAKVTMADGFINGKIGDVYSLPLAETPAFITELASQLAAAFVLIDEYGKEAQDTDKDGYKRLGLLTNEDGTGILDKIQKKELKLFSDTTSQELNTATTRTPIFRPNNLSQNSTNPEVSTKEKIMMNKIY
jgi:hypothetical protein